MLRFKADSVRPCTFVSIGAPDCECLPDIIPES
jgi:hypothetical protein